MIQDASSGIVCFEPYLSIIAQTLVQNPIRRLAEKQKKYPNCLALSGGRPPKEIFPEQVHSWGGEDYMNYGPALARGTDELKKWANEFVQKFHTASVGMQNHDVLITSGNTDGITKAVMLLTDPGDLVLADEVTYPGIQGTALPLGRRVLGVPMDQDGMIPSQLEATLDGLASGMRARILYLTPHGQNPTGATLTESRKDAIYVIARRHNLTILEDDAYFFVNLTPTDPDQPLDEKNMPGLERAPRSFLARDTDGRVVRLDTVSKMLAPGYRLGWATGNKALMSKWAVLGEVFTWTISGVQQRSFLEIVNTWGQEGLHIHLQRLQYTYAQRRDFLLAACERHLTSVCRWHVPAFGMFFWLEIIGCPDTEQFAEELIESWGVAMIPGNAFKTPEGASKKISRYFRVSFSLLREDIADSAMSKLKDFLLSKGIVVSESVKDANVDKKRQLDSTSAVDEVESAKMPKATIV